MFTEEENKLKLNCLTLYKEGYEEC